jgi:hypothetical protein
MKGLIHKVGERSAVDRDAALNAYRTLLYSEGEATDEHAAELEQVMKTLGKTVEDVRQDMAAVEEYRRWSAQALTEAQADRDYAAAVEAMNAHNEEWAQSEREHRARHNGFIAAQMNAQAQRDNAREARRRAAVVYARHTEALAGLEKNAESPCVYRITCCGNRQPVPDGWNYGVYFQGGEAHTVDRDKATFFEHAAGQGFKIECVETAPEKPIEAPSTAPVLSGSGPGGPSGAIVNATTTEPAAEPSPDAPAAPEAEPRGGGRGRVTRAGQERALQVEKS